eukprot:jgi/Orpsp1_1/1174693/evm.model.c7180000051003.1
MIINFVLFYFWFILCFFTKLSWTFNSSRSENLNTASGDIPIKYLPEKTKNELQRELGDNAYISAAGGTIDDFSKFYDQLTQEEKSLYDLILAKSTASPLEFLVETTYDDSGEKSSKNNFVSKFQNFVNTVITVAMYEHPELWWIGRYSFSYTYDSTTFIHEITLNLKPSNSLFYAYTLDNFNSINGKLNIMKDDILKKIEELSLTTDYAILRYIHDYLIVRNTYLLDEKRKHIRNIFGGIVENRCVCEGYAEAFQYLAQQVGVDCIIARSNTHEWNLVKMGSSWYEVDVTWDDPGNSPSGYGYDQSIQTTFFLAGESTVTENDSNNSHVLIYSAFSNHNAVSYPPISEEDYSPTDDDTSELNTILNNFATSYFSTKT